MGLQIGLIPNLGKCELWTSSGNQHALAAFPQEMRRLSPDGFELLGIAVGNKAFCEAVTSRRIDKIATILSKLSIIDDPQVELALLRSCLGYPRFAFALRATPPALIADSIRRFDLLMEKTSTQRFDLAFDEDQKAQWSFPVRMGGVGIFRAQEVAPAAFLSNAIQCSETMSSLLGQEISALEVPGADDSWNAFRSALFSREQPLSGDITKFLSDLSLLHVIPPSAREDPEALIEAFAEGGDKPQHCLHSILQERKIRDWLSLPPRSQGESTERCLLRKLAVMRGDTVTGYVGSWLNVVPNRFMGFKMIKPVFSSVLKWWLGEYVCPPGRCPEYSVAKLQCPSELDPWGDHAVCCPTGATRIARHDLVNAS